MKNIFCADIQSLRGAAAGTLIALEGKIVSLRDRSLARLSALHKNGEPLPVDLAGRIVFFAGPTPGFADRHGSVGPTTSRRMAAYLPLLAELGAAALIGKGPFDSVSVDLLKERRILYLQAAGGAGAYYGARVSAINPICFDDLGAEGIFDLTVHDFVAIMSIDGAGAVYP